jgi:hypothetical protein
MYPYFENVIGALDGSHFHALIPPDEQTPWRNRKGFISTNVLVACDLEGKITYILPGWEGSANDGRVFTNALTRKLVILEGCYYLGDGGYSSSQRLLVPYRGTRYHLQESARAGLRPATYQELWNLRHSQLRTLVERVIGRLKLTFRIHRYTPHFGIKTQVKILFATAALYNWLFEFENLEDIEPEGWEPEENPNEEPGDGNNFTASELQGGAMGKMNQMRDQIAKKMWEDYCQHLRQSEGEQ